MDITFCTEQGRFNYRVCAIIINDDKLLAMHDERSPYYYLPGGRVKLHETAEEAIIRELQEELRINAKIIRPLWLNQSFFTEVHARLAHRTDAEFVISGAGEDHLVRAGYLLAVGRVLRQGGQDG